MMHEITLLGRSGFFKNLGLSLLFNHSGSQPQRETSKNMVTEGYASLPERDGQSVDHPLDLNELCVKHPTATFFLCASGEAMQGMGIAPNDILVVDRALQARHGDLVVVRLNGQFMVRKLATQPQLRLLPLNSRQLPISVNEGMDMEVFGVVAHVIRSMLRN